MTVTFFHIGQEIFINNFIPEVYGFLFGQISDTKKVELGRKIIANKEARDFLFRIFMGNIVDEKGEQFSGDNWQLIYNGSWTFVFILIQHQCRHHKSSAKIEEIIFDSIGTAATNNRFDLEKQHRAIHNNSDGALAYINLCILNARRYIFRQEKRFVSLHSEDGKREMHFDTTLPDVGDIEDIDIIEVAHDYMGSISDGLLLPNPLFPQTMFMDWFVELDNMIFSKDWLSTKFTAVNQVLTIERLILFRQAVRQDDFSYITSIMDQCRRCKRNLIQKLLKDIFADLQMLEDVYDEKILSSLLCVVMPEVFAIPDHAKKKWEQRGNAATELKNRFDFFGFITEVYLPRLNQLVNQKVDHEQFLIECQTMRHVLMMIVVIHTLQQRTSKHRNHTLDEQNASYEYAY